MSLATFSRAILLLCATFSVAAASHAQQSPYPTRPIKIIVGTTPGASTDGLARLYAQKLQELLKVPVVVDNKPGAANLVAIRAIQQAAPDGYTLYASVGSSLAQGPAIRKDLPYDPLKDFTLISFLGTSAGSIYVHTDVPASSIAEFVSYLKAHPGKLSFGSAGIGSAGHLQAEYFMSVTGTKMVHVPYKSDPDAAMEVSTGRVDVGFTTARPILPFVLARKVRPLATIDKRRLSQLPNVPAVPETGVKGLESLAPYSFFGLVGPAGMSPAVVNRLNEAVNRISAMPDVVVSLRDTILVEPMIATPAEFRTFIEKETAKWREVGKTVSLKD